MNTDPRKSAQPCGCDPGANYQCERHRAEGRENETLYGIGPSPDQRDLSGPLVFVDNGGREIFLSRPNVPLFPPDAAGRKTYPMFTGLLAYFPDALAAVAHVSYKGNEQHNPGQPLHWAREKSTDQTDTTIRHTMDHAIVGAKDTDGEYHLAKAIWRMCAELQHTIEREKANG